jgi:hypothetical protein
LRALQIPSDFRKEHGYMHRISTGTMYKPTK